MKSLHTYASRRNVGLVVRGRQKDFNIIYNPTVDPEFGLYSAGQDAKAFSKQFTC